MRQIFYVQPQNNSSPHPLNFNNSLLYSLTNPLTTYNGSHEAAYPYKTASFVCGCLLLPIAMFGLVANLVTVWIFGRKPASINVLLVGLAFFDMWLLLTATPIFSSLALSSLYEAHMRALWGFLTLYVYPLAMAAQSASAWTMILISIDRYFAVCRPFSAMVYCTVRRSKVSLAVVLALALAYNVCRFYEYRLDAQYPVYDFELTERLRGDALYKDIYVHWMYLLFVYAIPLAFLAALNSLVVVGLRKAAVDRRHLSSQQNRENRTSWMMLVVVVVFLCCNSLAFVLNAMETASISSSNYANMDWFYLLTDFNNLLVEFNSSVNCVVYYAFSSHYQGRVDRLISVMSARICNTRLWRRDTTTTMMTTYGSSCNLHCVDSRSEPPLVQHHCSTLCRQSPSYDNFPRRDHVRSSVRFKDQPRERPSGKRRNNSNHVSDYSYKLRSGTEEAEPP